MADCDPLEAGGEDAGFLILPGRASLSAAEAEGGEVSGA